MFFNKLKEEIKKEINKKLVIFVKKYTEDIVEGIKINHKTTEELIEKYKHTKWTDLTPFEAGVLISKFNLVEDSQIGLYVDKNTCFMPWHFVGDTLQADKERKETELKKVKQENKLSSLSNPIADKNAVTLEQIETVLKTQKSSPKAIKAIKELIKIRYEE